MNWLELSATSPTLESKLSRRWGLSLDSRVGDVVDNFVVDEVLVEAARVLHSHNKCYVAKNKTSGRKTRFDAGSKKPISALPENTEAAFLRKRKADLKGLTRGAKRPLVV